jgi:hypothetical protein
MSDYTTTPNLGLLKPTPNADGDLWGDHLNQNADTLDALLGTTAPGPFLPLTGGTVAGPLTVTGAMTLSGATTVAGRLTLTGLPTSASGLPAGTVWSNGGVLCVA